jgi:hypothetical protein
VTGDDDNDKKPDDAGGKAPAQLRVVHGPVCDEEMTESAPVVRIRREFKGLTVADLHREEIVTRLPGQVRSALEHIEAADYAAAEDALPGQFDNVLVGPGHRGRYQWRWFAFLSILAVVVGWVVALGMSS